MERKDIEDKLKKYETWAEVEAAREAGEITGSEYVILMEMFGIL